MKTIFLTKEAPWGGLQKSVGDLIDNNSNSLVNYVEFNITERCRGGCITCPTIEKYADEKTKKTIDDLTEELNRFKEMFRKMKDLGMNVLSLYGRESTLWDEESSKLKGETNFFLKELINWLSNDLSVRVCLLSSGLELDESLLRLLFDNQGILFMKNWGNKSSFETLMKHKNAYQKNQKSWNLVQKIREDYEKTRVIAEFLYTGINRKDLPKFWRNCLKNDILPFVEVPTIRGDCKNSYKSLEIKKVEYVKDIYVLSLLNISLLYNMDLKEVKNSDLWHPPYGSVFPMQCNKLTKAKSIFLERNGDLTICPGIPVNIGNIGDENIKEKLSDSAMFSKIRQSYQNLAGWCANCSYSDKMNICYGCRGNAYTYSDKQSVFAEDPMCFGRVALNLEDKKLRTFMSECHIQRLKESFEDK